MTLEEFIIATNRAKTSEDVFELYQKALQELGYDRICYSLITDHPSLGLETGHGVMANYPEDWMSHYFENNYQALDPVPQFCFKTQFPFTWENDALIDYSTNSQKALMNEANEAKLYDGIAIPIHGINGELSGVGLASSSGGINPTIDQISIIRALSFQFHASFTDKEKNNTNPDNITLSDREREILLWSAEGKSDSIIAEILGISYATVRFHMNKIFTKLDVNEKTLAVVKAIRLGLILPTYINPQ